MASVFDARCLGCDYRQRIIGCTDYAYRLSEVPDVFLWAQIAWCDYCHEIVQAERMLTATESKTWVADGTPKRLRRDAERYREMLTFRRSPARCLRCGTTDIHAASGDRNQQHVLHPECGKDIVLHHAGLARLGSHTHIYTPEGEYLETVDSVLVPGKGS